MGNRSCASKTVKQKSNLGDDKQEQPKAGRAPDLTTGAAQSAVTKLI